MIKAEELRDKENLKNIAEKPGYYKWWAERRELDVILRELQVGFSDISSALEGKDGLFCIYVGIAAKESVRARLNWHVNDRHTESQVRNGTLSTLRQSIASIVAHNQYDKSATDAFIDKLYVEWFYSENAIKSETAKSELHDIEQTLLAEHFRILNIQENRHPLSEKTKTALKSLRKQSKNMNFLT